jgi:signal peptidase II
VNQGVGREKGSQKHFMSYAKRFILIFIVLVACVGCDQATKSIAMSVLPTIEPWSYLSDTVRLQLVYNRGAFLGLGSSFPETLRQGVFVIGSGLLLVGALTYAFLHKPGRPTVVLAIALFSAGGVGNLFDRVARGGLVVDFINIGIGPVRTGIFNIADIAIMVGVFIFLLATLLPHQFER